VIFSANREFRGVMIQNRQSMIQKQHFAFRRDRHYSMTTIISSRHQ